MKKIIAIFSLMAAMAFNANAGLIASESIDGDGNLIVEFHLYNTNPDLFDFGFALNYDVSTLTWDDFYGDYMIGFQTNNLVVDHVFADGEDIDFDGVFDLYGFFYDDGWAADIGTDVFLGSAKFLVNGNLATNNFDIELSYAYNILGDDITPSLATTDVPEPPAIALMSVFIVGLVRQRYKLKQD
ncbi:hypothetical protein Q4575_08960 [Psychrosphaera sp. 1_MG-2023]|uniref:hypothetical protein n=1 Tax=Psychrosphaera sp. 1_MG-2023 TaxID=3062643 RepID=UPI0026E2B281|nr:hypothetical protein [Psychrosphaera sp. 1_MG-2023]MDO6719529.1 hypothetical protein [Psychrosphaera sp. 1_MG-2023]